MSKVISVKNLQKSYRLGRSRLNETPSELQAVKGISFEVAQGEIFGILGPNGAGKTTTLEILEGLKDLSGGEVTILGLDLLAKQAEVKRRIGVQLQSSEYMNAMSLSELLHLFASLYDETANVEELLGFVNLVDKKNSLVKDLSGGQKQRFTIATALVNNPEIVFLDEPTTGLDPRARRDVWELIRSINERGTTIVMTTHYMEEAEYLCNRVAVMDGGEILAIGNPKKLIEDLSSTTQVSFLTDKPLPEDFWSGLKGIVKVFNDHPKVFLEISSLGVITAILELLESTKINFSSFTVKTSTLEDVYLHLTGKAYED